MLFNGAEEIFEMFKGSLPVSLIFLVPILIIISPANPVYGSHDFPVYRMQQYDLHGVSYGSQNSLISFEARTLDAKIVTRRCILAKLRELTAANFRNLATMNAAGLIILIPHNLSQLSVDDQNHLLELEVDLMQEETALPVYFAEENEVFLSMYKEIQNAVNSDQAGSAFEALLSSASSNGYQFTITGSNPRPLTDFQIINIHGKLSGYGIEEQLPSIAIVAHYDSYGLAPSLSFGADSNGSGVAALLELSRLFAKLYTNSRTHAKYNLLFLLSGGGKFNYQGTKKWIEDQMDSNENSILPDVSYVLCLDTLGGGNNLSLHVSKPPKEGSSGDILNKNLESSARLEDTSFQMIHKKINLAEDFLAWEHERFSMRRLQAFTLSHLSSHKENMRHSILDTRKRVDIKTLARNINILAEALSKQIFNLSDSESIQIFKEGLKVEELLLTAWMDYLSNQPRSAQLIQKDSQLINTLEQAMSRNLKDVKKSAVRSDKRDPEFLFYDMSNSQLNAYSVKPAIFDLYLAIGIAFYLALIYLNFNLIYSLVKRTVSPMKSKHH